MELCYTPIIIWSRDRSDKRRQCLWRSAFVCRTSGNESFLDDYDNTYPSTIWRQKTAIYVFRIDGGMLLLPVPRIWMTVSHDMCRNRVDFLFGPMDPVNLIVRFIFGRVLVRDAQCSFIPTVIITFVAAIIITAHADDHKQIFTEWEND